MCGKKSWTVYGRSRLAKANGSTLKSSPTTFACDILRNCTLTTIPFGFEEGAQFVVRSDDAAIRGPEAFEFNGKNQLPVVEQND